MAGGCSIQQMDDIVAELEKPDLSRTYAVFCRMCEWKLKFSDLKESSHGGALTYVCPSCGEILAIKLGDGRVVPYESWNKKP